MIYIVLLQCFVLPWAWAVVLRGTTNLPITPWIWDDTALRHDHLMHSVKQASVWLVISCIFSWSTVSAQEPIGHVFHAKYPSSSANLHNTSELWPPYLLIGLHGQCTHVLGPFRLVSVVGCKWEWTILVCGRDWLWLCLYVYVRNGLHHDNVIHTLARPYCLPHSQWLLLEWFFARLTAEHAYTWDTLYFYQLIYPTICDVTHPLFDM